MMQATTFKLENPLLKELYKIMPKKSGLSAFVRNILEQEILRQKKIKAALEYQEFMASHPDEQLWLEEWESVDLAKTPKSKKTKRKRS